MTKIPDQKKFWMDIAQIYKEKIFQEKPEWEFVSFCVGGGRVLDIGCGEGRHIKGLIEKGISPSLIYGIDLVPRARLEGVSILEGNIYSTNFDEDFFDNILFFDALHHLENPRKALKEIRRISRKGCRLFLNAFSFDDPSYGRSKMINNFEMVEGDLYSRFFNEDFLKALLQRYISITRLKEYQRKDFVHTSIVRSREETHSHNYFFVEGILKK